VQVPFLSGQIPYLSARADLKVFLLLFLQKKKKVCSFLKKRTKRLLRLRGFMDTGLGRIDTLEGR
jgi:hypothetical protein